MCATQLKGNSRLGADDAGDRNREPQVPRGPHDSEPAHTVTASGTAQGTRFKEKEGVS